MMDLVPLAAMTADGESAQVYFSGEELSEFVAGNEAAVRGKIGGMLEALANQPGGEVHGECRGFQAAACSSLPGGFRRECAHSLGGLASSVEAVVK